MHRFRSVVAVLGALVVLTTAAGCSSGSTDANATPATNVAAETSFPVTVKVGERETKLEKRPEAIISLSPSSTEMLYAIGAGGQVKAVDASSNFPADAPVTELSGFKPNVEALANYQPDLVVVGRDRDGIVDKIQQAGIPVLLLPAPSGFDEIYEQITALGTATGHPGDAQKLVADMRKQIDETIAALPKPATKPKAFVEIGEDYSSTTSASFLGAVFQAMNLENIADGVDAASGAYPKLNAEFVLGAEPDYVFVAHSGTKTPTVDEIAARPGWATLPAVVNKKVIVLDTDIASRWGPRVVDLVKAVAAALK